MNNPQSEKPADPDAARDAWLSMVKPAADLGKLEKIPTRKARTRREKEQARKQNYWLTRSTFGMPEGYERIKWKSRLIEMP